VSSTISSYADLPDAVRLLPPLRPGRVRVFRSWWLILAHAARPSSTRARWLPGDWFAAGPPGCRSSMPLAGAGSNAQAMYAWSRRVLGRPRQRARRALWLVAWCTVPGHVRDQVREHQVRAVPCHARRRQRGVRLARRRLRRAGAPGARQLRGGASSQVSVMCSL